ncbi:hypothetical protein ACFVUW_30110 [Streptomyces xiamenensis]|uniref:hypothetical protein n=1 Tax=Streptomyces xiamenensis TaxID=408015 RepID=UPI0036EB2216
MDDHERDELLARIEGLATPEPERPTGIDPDVEHEVTVVDAISYTAPNPFAQGEPMSDASPPPTMTSTLACQQCGSTSGWTLRGRWGSPAVISCAAGHVLESRDHRWLVSIMQRALVTAAR